MDVLNPELVWIGQRCYRVNIPNKDSNKSVSTVRTLNYEDQENEDDDGEFGGCSLQLVDENAEKELEEIGNGKFQLKMHCPQMFHSHVIGAKGNTKKRIEQQNYVQIIVPKMGSRDKIVLLKGTNKQDIMNARNEIQSIISSGRSKQNVTHFVSIPCNNDEVKSNFTKFRDSILHDVYPNMDEKLFQKPEKLHLTLEVLVLLDDIDRTLATEVFSESKNSILDPILKKGPLKLKISGVNIFDDAYNDPSNVHVLFANVESEHLQEIANEFAKLYGKRRLAKKERVEVKLHLTLINSSFLESKDEQLPRKNSTEQTSSKLIRNTAYYKRKAFDAREILENYKDFYFGSFEVNEIHLSCIGNYAENGFYKSSAVINIE